MNTQQVLVGLEASWDWKKFAGSEQVLRYGRRELIALDMAINYVPKHDVVVQAGGNLGIFPKYLSYYFKAVYTFEPDPELFLKMIHNAPEHNIFRMQAALGCDHRLVAVSRVRRYGNPKLGNHEGLTYVDHEADGLIPMMTVDDLKLQTCDLIYFDIEGYELFALIGAAKTIAHCRPVVVCEINQGIEQYGHDRGDVEHYMETHNYRWEATLNKNDNVFLPVERK